jgi:hypothetical protein
MASNLNVNRSEQISADENTLSGNDGYVVSLLHMDGPNAGTTFTDNARNGAHTWTASGNASIQTSDSVFGGASGVFDGTGDYINTPYSSDFDFDVNDLTWDLWVKWLNGPGAGLTVGLITVGYIASSNNRVQFSLLNKGGGGLAYAYQFVAVINGTTAAYYQTPYVANFFPSGWIHLAAVRNGSNFYIFINGVSQNLTVNTAIGTNSITPAVNEGMRIGRLGAITTGDFWGSMDEVRISKGIARWTSNFTAPTRAYGIEPGRAQLDQVMLPISVETVTPSEVDPNTNLSLASCISQVESLVPISTSDPATNTSVACCISAIDKANGVDPAGLVAGKILLDHMEPTRIEQVRSVDPAGLVAGKILLDHMEPTGIETVTASEPPASFFLPTLIISILDTLQANDIYSPLLDKLIIQASDAIQNNDVPASVLDTLLLSMIETVTESDLPQPLLAQLLIQLLETISANVSPGIYYDFVIQMLETITGSDEFQSERIEFAKLIQMVETLIASEVLTKAQLDTLIIRASDIVLSSENYDQQLEMMIHMLETIAASDIPNPVLEELFIKILEILTLNDEKRLTEEFITLRGEFLFNRFGRIAPSVTAGGNFKFSQNKTESPPQTPGGNFKYKKPKDN